MKNYISCVALTMVSSLSMACGSGTSDGGSSGSCGAARPSCGGTLDGTWRIASTCVRGDLDAALTASSNNGAAVPASCNGLFQGFTLDAQGTATFANSQETDQVTTSMTGNAVYTPACVSAIAGMSVTLTSSTCKTMESGLTSSGGFDSASCTFNGGNCVCKLAKTQLAPTAPQPYTVSTGTITYTNPSDTPAQYCVTGTTLTLEESTGISDVTTESVLNKM